MHWRALAAVCLGMASGLSTNSYLLSIFAPYLLDAFGWSKSQWAMLGVIQFLVMVTLPIAGRLTDNFGVRRVAMFGSLAFPCFQLALSFSSGDIRHFFWTQVALVLCTSTTTATVFSRVIATSFSGRRGLAFGVMGIATPLFGALASPLLTALMDRTDWNTGFRAIAIYSLVCAIGMLVLLPPDHPGTILGSRPAAQPTAQPAVTPLARPWVRLLSTPALWIMLIATFLANLPFALASMQLKMVALDQGLDSGQAALMVSAFAVGAIGGRVLGGLALDLAPSTRVAAVSFLLPVIGLLVLAMHPGSIVAVTAAILLIGFSFGGEGDVLPYLITRYFPISLFSSAMGVVSSMAGAAMAGGNVILGAMLGGGGSYATYMVFAATTATVGALLFLLLERQPVAGAEAAETPLHPA